ncbi:hypothetical protein QBC40DRAFT_290844 [Triangularia verruculosa]|uniref:Uncharacterized protein n=1 Tax=Triangularia verruculosa TaxID=2587418 RepID=A0AAN7APK0_9PEZI|nr:hypothetical protein QBC40DRAFT_290844 [Triangularia verruculosa]
MTAGLDTENGLTGGGCDVPRIALFNENGNPIANRVPSRNEELKTGETKEYKVPHHKKNRQQSTYAQFIECQIKLYSTFATAPLKLRIAAGMLKRRS